MTKTKPILLLLALYLGGCAVAVTKDDAHLPDDCEVKDEYIRVQLCPNQDVAVVCSDASQTNFDPVHCDGPDWTEHKQETGTAWCCNNVSFYKEYTGGGQQWDPCDEEYGCFAGSGLTCYNKVCTFECEDYLKKDQCESIGGSCVTRIYPDQSEIKITCEKVN